MIDTHLLTTTSRESFLRGFDAAAEIARALALIYCSNDVEHAIHIALQQGRTAAEDFFSCDTSSPSPSSSSSPGSQSISPPSSSARPALSDLCPHCRKGWFRFRREGMGYFHELPTPNETVRCLRTRDQK